MQSSAGIGQRRKAADPVCPATSLASAQAGVIDYIEMSYNSQRQFSYLGDTSPMEFEAKANAA